MVEDTPNSDNHQELKAYFKSTGEMLFFGLVVTPHTFVLPADAEEKDKEKIIREYKRQSDDPWIARKITRCAPAYTSGLIFSVVCMLLGLLFVVFRQLNIRICRTT